MGLDIRLGDATHLTWQGSNLLGWSACHWPIWVIHCSALCDIPVDDPLYALKDCWWGLHKGEVVRQGIGQHLFGNMHSPRMAERKVLPMMHSKP